MIGRTNALALAGQVQSSYILSNNNQVSGLTMVRDGDYIYFSGSSTGYAKGVKISASDLTLVSSATIQGGIFRSFVQGDYLYYSTISSQSVYKLSKTDLSVVDSTATYGGLVYGIATDGTYLYVGGLTIKTIRKYALTDLTTLVAESSAMTNGIRDIPYDNGNLYISDGVYIYEYDVATLSLQTTSVAINSGSATKIVVNSGYLYMFNNAVEDCYIYKLDIATLQTLTSVDIQTNGKIYQINDITIYDSVIYAVGRQTIFDGFVLCASCDLNLANVTTIENPMGIYMPFNRILVDTNSYYVTNSANDSVLKIARS